MEKKYTMLRGLLWVICVYHVILGLMALFTKQGVIKGAMLLGSYDIANFGPEFFYIIKPFGIYAIVFGVSMGLAAWNPIKNRAMISVGVILFVLRALQRIIFVNDTSELLNVSVARNTVTILIVWGFTIALLTFRLLLLKDMKEKNLVPEGEVKAE